MDFYFCCSVPEVAVGPGKHDGLEESQLLMWDLLLSSCVIVRKLLLHRVRFLDYNMEIKK